MHLNFKWEGHFFLRVFEVTLQNWLYILVIFQLWPKPEITSTWDHTELAGLGVSDQAVASKSASLHMRGPSPHRGHLSRSAPEDQTTLLGTGSSLSTFFSLSCLKQFNWSKKNVLHWSSPDWKFLFLCQRKLEQFAGKYIKIKTAYIFEPLFYLVSYWTKVKCDLQLGGPFLD